MKITKPFQADSHRFGNRVMPVINSGVTQTITNFSKPRPVHLEYLFLDNLSTIADELNLLSPIRKTFKIEILDDWNGLTENQQIIETNIRYSESISQSFAYWSYLALAFGITDLHLDNFGYIPTKSGVQFSIFDIETIFESVNSIKQTSLLKEKPNSNCIFPLKIIPLSLFIDSFIYTHERGNPIIEDLTRKIWSFVQGIPIRYILRDTETYRKQINRVCDFLPYLIPEEVAQLKENDIPYFYRNLSSPKLRFFETRNQTTYVQSIECYQPLNLNYFSKKRLDQVFKVSLLQIFDLYWPPNETKLVGKNFIAEIRNDLLQVEFPNYKIASRLPRTISK